MFSIFISTNAPSSQATIILSSLQSVLKTPDSVLLTDAIDRWSQPYGNSCDSAAHLALLLGLARDRYDLQRAGVE